jgi:hypothetical protein
MKKASNTKGDPIKLNANDASSPILNDELVMEDLVAGLPVSSSLSHQNQQVSFTTVSLILIIFLGLGSFAGLAVFHTILHDKCLVSEPASNSTLQILHHKLITAMADHKRCLDDDSRLEELNSLRGRLESQIDVISVLSKEVEGKPMVKELQNHIQKTTNDLTSIRDDFEAAKIVTLELERALNSARESLDKIVNHTRQRQSVMCRQL